MLYTPNSIHIIGCYDGKQILEINLSVFQMWELGKSYVISAVQKLSCPAGDATLS